MFVNDNYIYDNSKPNKFKLYKEFINYIIKIINKKT